MLLIIKPLALIVSPIGMRVGAHTFSLVVDPLALVDIAIGVHKLPLSVRLVIPPLSFIPAAIGPQLGANAVAHAIEPLAGVGGAIAQGVGALCDAAVLVRLLIWGRLGHTFTEHAASLAIVGLLNFIAYMEINKHAS